MPKTTRICEHTECQNAGEPCRLEVGGPIEEYLCDDHMKEAGYCYFCGYFSAGQTGFDIVHPGICDYCKDEIDAENSSKDAEDDFVNPEK